MQEELNRAGAAVRPVRGFTPEYAAPARSTYGGKIRVGGDELPRGDVAASPRCSSGAPFVVNLRIALSVVTLLSIVALFPAALTSEWEVCTADVHNVPGMHGHRHRRNSTTSFRSSLGLMMRCISVTGGAHPIGCEGPGNGKECHSCSYVFSAIVKEAARTALVDANAGFAVDFSPEPTMQRLALPRYILSTSVLIHIFAMMTIRCTSSPLSGGTSAGTRYLRCMACLRTRIGCPGSGHGAAVALGVLTLVVWWTYVLPGANRMGFIDPLPPGVTMSSLRCGWSWGVGAVVFSVGAQLLVAAPLAALVAVQQRRHSARPARGGAAGNFCGSPNCCGSRLRGAVASSDLGAARNVSALAVAVDERGGGGGIN
jgi:hypothetical protein